MAAGEHTRRAAVAAVQGARDEFGRIPERAVAEAAFAAGVSPRTVRRWLAQDNQRDECSRSFELAERMVEEFVANGGNVRSTYRKLSADGVALPSERTFRRRIQELDAATRGWASDGEQGLRDGQVYLRFNAPHRNHTWQADHGELPVWVIPEGRRRAPVKPYMTAMIDDATRTCTGWALDFSGRGGVRNILGALAHAVPVREIVSGDGDRVEIGGVPTRLRPDNGADFRSHEVRAALNALGVEVLGAGPYHPWQKGKVERFLGVMQEELCAALPGFASPQRDRTGESLLRGDDVQLMSAAAFIDEVDRWVTHYNHERSHSAVGGRTPLQAWKEDPSALVAPLPETVRACMPEHHELRTVNKEGIRFRNRNYIAPALLAHRGRKLAVRYLPHDDAYIEAYVDGDWIATCWRADLLSPDSTVELMRERSRQGRRARERTDRVVAQRGRRRDRETRVPANASAVTAAAADGERRLGGGRRALLDLAAGEDAR